jgi:3-phenylpropionate/cinnamic acid dioxygenase small subunit
VNEPGAIPSSHVTIANLLYRYAELIDAGDFTGVGELLAHAVITTDGSDAETVGADAIVRMYERSTRRYDDGTPRSKHLITNPIIEVDEARGTATCRSNYTVLQQTDVLALQPIITGRYRDEFTRVGHEWRFTRRHMGIDLVGDLSQHLLFDLPPRA